MSRIDVILPARRARRWHIVLLDRLARAGHDVKPVGVDVPDSHGWFLDMVLSVERRLLRRGDDWLCAPVPAPLPARAGGPHEALPDLVIDLACGRGTGSPAPRLELQFDGCPDSVAAARVLAGGGLPRLSLLVDGTRVAEAAPMIDSRVLVVRGLQDILARAITMIEVTVDRLLRGALSGESAAMADEGRAPARAFATSYLASNLPRLAAKTFRRLRYWEHHWRVGYRFIDGPGVAETGTLGGAPWSVLPDDGRRFYADPFPVEVGGRHFLFVEELDHAVGKGVISVATTTEDGRFGVPRPVLEEDCHFSYPQVFEHGGHLWMMPQAGRRGLTLYRADSFPDRWVRHAELIPDRFLIDATLLEHGGRFWIFATEWDGLGSASDTLVVFHAERLEGPWRPHALNPVRTHRSWARPGGAFVKSGGGLLLPIQDGTLGYGGGLGLSAVRQLDEATVDLAPPRAIATKGDWPYPRIHTLNRAGRLETIDGAATVSRRKGAYREPAARARVPAEA